MSDVQFLSDKSKDRIAKYFCNPNRNFFTLLRKMVMTSDKKKPFKIERLNNGINLKSKHILNEPLKYYADIIKEKYNLSDNSVWAELSDSVTFEKSTKKIPRTHIIAIGFVFRLSFEEVNTLLKAASYTQLYPRSILDSSLIFVLDMYRSSSYYTDFLDSSIELSSDAFIENFIYFTELCQKFKPEKKEQSKLAEKLTKCIAPNYGKCKEEKKGSRETWKINYKELNDIINSDTELSRDHTQECMLRLLTTIESSKKLGYRDNSLFGNYIETNSSLFVSNHERAYKYLINMILRYQDNIRYKTRTDEKRNVFFEKKIESQISLNNFFNRFSVFMDDFNIYSSSKKFLIEYISFDESDLGGYEEDIETFRENVFTYSNGRKSNGRNSNGRKTDESNDENFDENEVRKLFCDRVRLAISLNTDKYEYRDDCENSTELTAKEKKLIQKIIKSDSDATKKGLENFKGILSAEKDISRMMFIMLYLFTDNTVAKNRSKLASARINELNKWLLHSGFVPISGAEKEFVKTFYKSAYSTIDREKWPDDENSKEYHFDHHVIEEEQFYYFNDAFSYLHNRDIEVNIADVHLQCTSIMDEELSLLP